MFAELPAGLPPLLATTREPAPAAKGPVASDEGAALGASQSSGSERQPKVAGLGLDSPHASGAADNTLIPAIAVGLALLTPLVAVVLFRRRPERGLAGAGGDGQTAQVADPARAAPPWGLPPYEESPPPATGSPARARAVPPELAAPPESPAPPESENGNAPVRPGLIRSALITFGLGQFLRNRR